MNNSDIKYLIALSDNNKISIEDKGGSYLIEITVKQLLNDTIKCLQEIGNLQLEAGNGYIIVKIIEVSYLE